MSTVKIAIDDSTGLSENPRNNISKLAIINNEGIIGYPGRR